MKVLDLLAKLGILRFGATAATYRSGTERPTELLMDGVFNAERDLTRRQDLRDLAAAVRDRPDMSPQAVTCPSCGVVLPAEPARFCPSCGAALTR